MDRALFLDRDGVINYDHGYAYLESDFEFVEGIFDVGRIAEASGYKVIVVTNQAGIGRGYYTESQFRHLSRWMCEQFAIEGIRITDVYFCPHHPEHGVGPYLRECPCRKPNPGMLVRAAREHDIDLGLSILVGDKHTDIEAGMRAGVGCTVLFGTQAGGGPLGKAPSHTATNHAELSRWLLQLQLQNAPGLLRQ